MKHVYWSQICDYFKLGKILDKPLVITGGLVHSLWKISTESGTYAIKKISNDRKEYIKNRSSYVLSEKIAYNFFRKDISTSVPITINNKIIYESEGFNFLVYKWHDGYTLDQYEVSESHAVIVARLIGRLHKIDLQLPEVTGVNFDVLAPERIENIFGNFIQSFPEIILNIKSNELVKLNMLHCKTKDNLMDRLVISHGDLHQKNILWDRDFKPTIIDWESARKFNPTVEIVQESLNWSGVHTNLNLNILLSMINEYLNADGEILQNEVEPAFLCVIGGWINWFLFSAERSINLKDEKSLAQTKLVSNLISYLNNNYKALSDKISSMINR